MYNVEFARPVEAQLLALPAREQRIVLAAIAEQLQYQPAVPTKNRKRLRPNDLATWELRIGEFRVYYDLNEADRIVSVIAVGVKKHNRVFIAGKEYGL